MTRRNKWQFRSRDLSVKALVLFSSSTSSSSADDDEAQPGHRYDEIESPTNHSQILVKLDLAGFNSHLVAALVESLKRSTNARGSFYTLLVKLFLAVVRGNRKFRLSKSDKNHDRAVKSNPNQIVYSIAADQSQSLALLIATIDYFNSTIISKRLLLPKIGFNVLFSDLQQNDTIIRTWTSIVNIWLIKKIHYDTHWAYLSTFGGAYSSLGEASREHAKNAEIVSKRQLLLALAFSDPNAICRCKIFLAFSFVQQGRINEAHALFKKEYKFLRDPENQRIITDGKLVVMCIAGLKRVRFVRQQNHLRSENCEGERKRS